VFSQFLYESGRETSNNSFGTTGLRSPPPDAHHTYELDTGSCNTRSKKKLKSYGHVLAVKCHLLSMYEQNQSKTLVSLNELHIQFTLKSYKELGGQLKGRPASPQVFLNARYFTS
jgi:hypothetical protein